MNRPELPDLGWRRMAGLLVCLVLTGCAASSVRTEVTAFNQWSTAPEEKTYVFTRTPEFQNSLEIQSYEDIVRDELEILGMKPASSPAAATISVTLMPTVTSRQIRVVEPAWDYDPFMYGYGYGYGRYPWGYPYPYRMHSYDYPVTLYQRRLKVEIDALERSGKSADQTEPARRRLYEATAESEGTSDSLTRVMPYLIRAIFTDFPGNNGETRRVNVPTEAKR